MKKNAFALVRVSTTEQDTLSQREDIVRKAKELGYIVEEKNIFAEKISGYDEYDEDRESIIQLRQAILKNKPSAIFIWELSRLTRNSVKVSKYIHEFSLIPNIPMYFADYRIWTIDPETGEINPDAVNTLFGGARAVEIERENIRKRTSRGRDAKAERGLFVGHIADGYKKELINGEKHIVVDKERAPVIKRIFELYNKEYSTRQIRDILNAEGIPPTNRYRYEHNDVFLGYKEEYKDRNNYTRSRADSVWTAEYVSRILTCKWYIGEREYHGVKYPINAIVSQEDFDKAGNRLAQFRQYAGTSKYIYPLCGVLFCGNCGRKMYGHNTHYLNHYYCSSFEYKRRKDGGCQLRGGRKESFDAIVYQLIMSRAYTDTILGVKTDITSFFDMDEETRKDLQDRIKNCKSIIARSKSRIDDSYNQQSFLIKQQGKYHDNPARVAQYEEQVIALDREVESLRNTIVEEEQNIAILSSRLRKSASIKRKLEAIRKMKDLATLKELIKAIISRIEVYNADGICSILRIKYINGKTDEVVYCPQKLKHNYLVLPKQWDLASKSPESEVEVYEENGLLIRYDEKEKKLVFDGVFFGTYGLSLSSKDEFEQNVERFSVAGLDFLRGRKAYYNEMSVREFVDEMMVSKLQRPFEDLEEMSAKGLEIKEKVRQRNKARATGKKTCDFFIEKDLNYDEIQLKRKHLYNRRYKIKVHKSMSEEEKKRRLEAIEDELAALMYQVKYIKKEGYKHADQFIAKQKEYERKHNLTPENVGE